MVFRGIQVISNNRAGDKLKGKSKVAAGQEPQIRGSFVVVGLATYDSGTTGKIISAKFLNLLILERLYYWLIHKKTLCSWRTH